MATVYTVQVIRVDHDVWETSLDEAIREELQALGVHGSVEVKLTRSTSVARPAVAVLFGSDAARTDPTCAATVVDALAELRAVIPVVADLSCFGAHVPPALLPINGWEWSGVNPARRLARCLLEELGIEESQRRVFISHRREDGLFAAEQLHDCLAHYGFDPFIDRFDIRPGIDVQRRIAEALEDRSFVLLVETPLAHESPWVFDEMDYALTHTMGLHIVTWPGPTLEVPGTAGLPRQRLGHGDLTAGVGYDALTTTALDAVVAAVEAAHAVALVRRTRQVLRSVEDAAEAAGLTCLPLRNWRLLVHHGSDPAVVGVTTRLPRVDDLFDLDVARKEVSPSAEAVLVHAARSLGERRRAVLSWASSTRATTLIPENAIGGYW